MQWLVSQDSMYQVTVKQTTTGRAVEQLLKAMPLKLEALQKWLDQTSSGGFEVLSSLFNALEIFRGPMHMFKKHSRTSPDRVLTLSK